VTYISPLLRGLLDFHSSLGFMQPVARSAFSPASVSAIDVCVIWRELMAVLAMGVVHRRTAENVHDVFHGFEVVRVDAQPVSAQVVNNKTGWYWSLVSLVIRAVSQRFGLGGSIPGHSIAGAILALLPNPALARRINYVIGVCVSKDSFVWRLTVELNKPLRLALYPTKTSERLMRYPSALTAPAVAEAVTVWPITHIPILPGVM